MTQNALAYSALSDDYTTSPGEAQQANVSELYKKKTCSIHIVSLKNVFIFIPC